MTSHFSVDIAITTPEGTAMASKDFSPETWKAAASQMLVERDDVFGTNRCVIVPQHSADSASPVEHVIPQGTGIRWISLPRGATSGEINSRASKWELAFLKDGLLGMLRPFYVGSKKHIEFKDDKGRRIVFRNDPDTGFIIETHDMDPLSELAQGPGQLIFTLPVQQAPTTYVSRALTKIAYLTLAVVKPQLAFSPALDQVREYLANEDAPYRPYGEAFCAGVGPRAGVRFDAFGEHLGGDAFGGDRFFAKVWIHHVAFFVPLIGEIPPTVSVHGLEWFGVPKPGGKRRVRFAFHYDDAHAVE